MSTHQAKLFSIREQIKALYPIGSKWRIVCGEGKLSKTYTVIRHIEWGVELEYDYCGTRANQPVRWNVLIEGDMYEESEELVANLDHA